VLLRAEPSPVVELNRAVAVAMRDGPEAGLALIDAILARGSWRISSGACGARGLVPATGENGEAGPPTRAPWTSRNRTGAAVLERRLGELTG